VTIKINSLFCLPFEKKGRKMTKTKSERVQHFKKQFTRHRFKYHALPMLLQVFKEQMLNKKEEKFKARKRERESGAKSNKYVYQFN
jgi:uncharacterized protein (DUF342 family)